MSSPAQASSVVRCGHVDYSKHVMTGDWNTCNLLDRCLKVYIGHWGVSMQKYLWNVSIICAYQKQMYPALFDKYEHYYISHKIILHTTVISWHYEGEPYLCMQLHVLLKQQLLYGNTTTTGYRHLEGRKMIFRVMWYLCIWYSCITKSQL